MTYLKDLKEGDEVWVVSYGNSITKAKVVRNEYNPIDVSSSITLDYFSDTTEFVYSGTATRGYECYNDDVLMFSDKDEVLEYLKDGIRDAEQNLKAKQSLLDEFLEN